MGSKLQINTKCQKRKDDVEEYQPVSPNSQYLSSEYLPLCIVGVFEFEVPIDDFNSNIEAFQKIAHSHPFFSSIMVDDENDEKRWKRVQVNIDDHLYFPSFPTNMALKEYDNIFDEYLSKVSADSLPQDKPLWQIHIIKYPTSNSAGNIIFKVSHAIGDGYTLMGVILSCIERADKPSLPLTFSTIRQNSKAKVPTSFESILSKINNTSYDFASGFWKSMIPDDKTPIKSGSEVIKAVKISTITISVDQIKDIKTALGVTINDVLTGIILLGIRLYMQEYGNAYGTSESTFLGVLNARNVNAYASVNDMQKPNTKAEWGNKVMLWHIPIPELTDQMANEPLDFVFEAQSLMKGKQDPIFVDLTTRSIEMLRRFKGTKVVSKYMHSLVKNTSVGLTNLIGPVEQMAIANRPIKGFYYMATGMPLSIVMTTMSYLNTFRIGVGVEKSFINVEKYCSCIYNAYEIIYKAAMEKPMPLKYRQPMSSL